MFVGVAVRQVRDLEKALRSQLGRLVPGEVPLVEAPAMWEAFDGIERLAASAKTLLTSRVDESRVWAREGDRSPADYLARKSGCSTGTARSDLETSRRLGGLPTTEAALRRGELSQAQAATIADAAAVNPGAEQSLVAAAGQATLVELRERANRAKVAADPDPDTTHRRLHGQRRLRRFTDAEGAWNIQGRGTPDAGAVFNAALDPIIDEIFRAARRTGRLESRDAYTFDALVELARRARGEAAHDRVAVDAPGGSADHNSANVAVSAGGRTRSRVQRPNPSFLAVLRVDLEALKRGRVHGDELCEIAGVGSVPACVARDLLGESILKLVITSGVDVVNVTHLGRGPSAAQRIAALWTTPACANSLCSHTLAIEHDHRSPWAEVHETVLGNIDRLCRPCHKRKTHDGWALAKGRGRRPLVPPDDPRHPGNRPDTGERDPPADPGRRPAA
jgi:Domain of unknown function (DUF222)